MNGRRTRIGVLVVAYNAISTLANTLDRIPAELMDRLEGVFVFDDYSSDNTFEAALEYKNARGLDRAAPRPDKFVGNRVLTFCENALLGTSLAEFHLGYRAYNYRALATLPLERCPDEWHLDTEIIIQLLAAGCRITETPIPTYYGDEICRVNGIAYAFRCMQSAVKYRLHQSGLIRTEAFALEIARRVTFKPGRFSSHGRVLRVAEAWPRHCRILEIGTASGYLGRDLRDRGFTDVSRVEGDLAAAAQASAYYRALVVADLEQGSMPDDFTTFDVLICADVLEHLREPLVQLRALTRLLKPGGIVVVSLPNVANWTVRLSLLAGRFPYRERGLIDRGHLRVFTQRTARRLIEDEGCTIEQGLPIPIPMAYVLPAMMLAVVTRGIERVYVALSVAWASLFAYQFVVVARAPVAPGASQPC